MRASRLDEASALARRIGQVIQYRNSIHLRRTDKADLSAIIIVTRVIRCT